MSVSDTAAVLTESVQAAFASRTPLQIQGGGSKAFLGNPASGEVLDVSGHRGVVHYESTELVITVKAGTPLHELEQVLAERKQMLPFEPPNFARRSTIGGCVACNLSGPRRAWAGAARDMVLGVRLLNGKGDVLRFGGEVMKNVAGYDVSRLMVGAMGTLGVLLDVSLKVLPRPEFERTQRLMVSAQQAQDMMQDLGQKPYPVSASCYDGEALFIRLSGMEKNVLNTAGLIGGDDIEDAGDFWRRVRDQEHDFFLDAQRDGRDVWRLSLPADAPLDVVDEPCLIEWAGAQRWYRGGLPEQRLRQRVADAGGHATLFRANTSRAPRFQPLSEGMMALHQRIKHAMDPGAILNPGRVYAGL